MGCLREIFSPSQSVETGLTVSDDAFGNATITFTVKKVARRVTARWHGTDLLKVTVPPVTRLDDIMEKLRQLAPRIMAKRPALNYSPGMTLQFHDFAVGIQRQSKRPNGVTLTGPCDKPVIGIGSNLDCNDPEVTRLVSNFLKLAAKRLAPSVLVPRAQQIADDLGIKPRSWRLTTACFTLGTCKVTRDISLSAMTLFLPLELQNYIICHELAHLSAMNHGPQFHRLCNAYCGNREQQLQKKLRKFIWPILR